MLEIRKASLGVNGKHGKRYLLSDISAEFPLGHFGAVIGPSGCGKSMLLKLIAGIAPGDEEGDVHWRGISLRQREFSPAEIGYVPQFGIAHQELTARESVQFARELRVRQNGSRESETAVEALLERVGLLGMADQPVGTLSGGQLRRLSLAMELTSGPDVLLCDEVTSGLDPHAQDDIVRLLHAEARDGGRLVLSVTHSLEHLELYDSVMVIFRGVIAYHGSPDRLLGYFGLDGPELLYSRLEMNGPEEWAAAWDEARDNPGGNCGDFSEGEPDKSMNPGIASQFLTLLKRRFIVFSRSGRQLALQAAFVLGFPLLVCVFAWNGLPPVENLSVGLGGGDLGEMEEIRDFVAHSSKVGGIVSGIVMFQVILLTLMGANNSGREIASERAIFEKEKISGLSPAAYVASKAAFLLVPVTVQSVWMALFVHKVCGMPGSLALAMSFLLLVNLAITSVCLGISAMMRTAEQASLASIYLVGFQLPLSGAVLALPEPLGFILRPLISAYWSWSGILQSLRSSRYYDVVQSVIQSPLAEPVLSVWILGIHIVAGLVLSWIGCSRRQFI